MSGGLMTQRWGWQPTAWLRDGLPTWRWRNAPPGLVTRRQMRAQGLAPGGAEPVAQVVCRRGRRRAWLYDPAELAPKRVPTPAQLAAVERALAARRWCPTCRRDVGYCIPLSLGECIDCHSPDPSATPTSTAPPPPTPTSEAITMTARTARTAVGPCRHCRQPLEHSVLSDENDQPVDWYVGRDDQGVLDSTCPSPDAPARDCDSCAGTGSELGDPDTEWDCDSCEGTGRTADHQPELPVAVERALAAVQSADQPAAVRIAIAGGRGEQW